MVPSDLEKQLAGLSPAKRALLEKKLRESSAPPRLRRREQTGPAPLSSAQQRLWLIHQMEPGSYLYNVPRVVRLTGRLDPLALQASLNEIVQRHEVLRTKYRVESGQPVGIVSPELSLDLPLTDLSQASGVLPVDRALDLALEEYRRPFDLGSGPVLRAHLWKLAEEDHILLILMHHIVSDGWTGGVLFHELGELYEAFTSERPSSLRDLPIQYADFAVWEKEWLARVAGKQVEYWRSTLTGAPPGLELPTDRPRPETGSFRGHTASLMLAPELAQRVIAFAQSQGLTLFPVMLAGLQALMYRWTGQSDVVLGTVTANRSSAELEKLIGGFMNFLALRQTVEGTDSIQNLLAASKKTALDAFSNQDCPFEKVVEAINPERATSPNPLYNVQLQVQNFPAFAFRGGQIEARFLPLDMQVAFLDLRFVVTESAGSILLECESNSDLFDRATSDLLLAGYRDVLEQMVTAATRTLGEVRIPDALSRQAQSVQRTQTAAVAATFTSEPIIEPLKFWMKRLGIPSKICFAPFNQILQQLFDPSSLFATNKHGFNAILLRIEDLAPSDNLSPTEIREKLTAQVEEFVRALVSAARRSAVAHIVCICPPSEAVQNNTQLLEACDRVERLLISKLAAVHGVSVISWTEILRLYPVTNYLDDYAWRAGKIPYTTPFFVALATMISRRLCAMQSSPHEVIVASCEQTLWQEAGSAGIEVDTPRRALQDFLIAEQEAGKILCVTGSGPQAAIDSAFSNPEMRLGWQHVASSQIGEQPVSEKLNSLAEELGIALESFVFVSGDSAECASVRAACPQVMVAELPTDEQQFAQFLSHFWPFDPRLLTSAKRQFKPETFDEIALRLASVDDISAAIESGQGRRKSGLAQYVAPRNAVEELLAGIWSKLLRVETPGIHDNFFALGGHSLLAVQVIARVRQTLDVEMPLRAMFDAPTIGEFAARVEGTRNTDAKLSIPPLKSVPRTGPVPLSYAQQRLWFIDQLEPGSPLYNISAMYRLKGTLNVDAMRRTINEIVRRHESLRTTFSTQDGQAIQIIARSLQLPLRIEVREGLSAQEREAAIQHFAKQEASQPFDLAKGPLLRFSLLKLTEDEHVLVVILHHIVGDGWSGSMLAAEMAAIYGAFSENRPSPLPELTVQYADFAIWQREWMQGEILEARLDYWKKQLAGAPPVLELPTDRPRPAVQAHHGAIQTHVIPRELLERVRNFSHAEGATLFMTLLAAFQLLLSRYSGQEDIVIGSTIASRNYSEIEPLIGFFVNTLALRLDLSGDPTFRELLARAKQAALDAYAHQEIPFEKLVEELQPERSLSYNPIFQVLFGLQNQPKTAFEASDLRVQRESIHASTSLFDMSWFAFETAEGLLLRVEYSTDLFDEETITRSLGHFEQLLKSIAASPERKISELPLLTAEDRGRVIVEFNDNAADYRTDIRLYEFFVEQAQRTPEAIAIICGGASLTYRELDRRSNQVARHLLSHGAAPDVLMGVFCERTPDLIVAILGILKSGGAYVPLDPAYPKERVANILEDAKVPVVLTQKSLIRELPNFAGKAICLDSDWEQIEGESRTAPPTATTPENLAYVLFTSGSTGRPKGVALEHRSAATFVQWAQTVFTPAELSGVLFSTSACFDLSIFEMFVPLSVGGTVIVVQNALFLPSDKARHRVTLINTVPSAMAELVNMGAVPKSVKTINLAGEALAETLVNEIYAETSAQKVYNLYGPTEDTTYSTYTLTRPHQRVTIGKPLPNSQAYVLDARGNPQPVGVPGELFLAGAGLARGYFGRPDLTAERFVANPFGNAQSPRIYKTGDLCRWLPNGELEYLGRLDHQVKLRGFRIELGEIEAVLARYSGVQQCLVMAREDQPGIKQLVAYVVPEAGVSLNVDSVRDHLKQSVPEFMVPSAFVVIEAFPLTPNGKINRKALPAPDRNLTARTRVAPRNPLEESIAEIWKKVLRIEEVGVLDDFFALGGHSLLATQVISRLRQSAGAELPLRAIFEAPTIAELARRVEEELALSGRHTRKIPRVPRTGPMPLSFAQQRLWFLNQLEPNNPLYNVPIAIGMSGRLHFEALERALNEIVRRHDMLRTTFGLRDNQAVQITAPELKLNVPVVDLSNLPNAKQEDEVKRLAIDGAKQVFDLETGPLFGATVLKLAPDDHVLLLNMHHIVSDGWSLWQFIREIAPLYGAFVKGKPSSLSDLPIQYADYAVWQRQWMSGDVLKQHLNYWTKQLQGAPDVFELPADRPRPPVQTYRGATITRKLPLELLSKLRSFSQGESATLFMTLLAAYQTLLFRYTGQPDLVVGSPIAGRNQADIEELIGFFVNAIVMRTDLSGNPSFRELVKRVRATALGAYAHQDLPFEKLVEVMQPERDLTRTPIFQVWFALQNAPKADFRLPGIELRTIDVHNGTSKFDLGLFVAEKQDGLSCMIEYSTDLFDQATIERFHDHFRVLLEAIVENPDQAITDLPILDEAERQQVVIEWNRTAVEYDRNICLHQIIEKQVEKTSDAPALIFESQQLSYRELNARANQLAHHLRKLGVGPEVLVGVCAERSVEMVVALLAIMKAGGAYVPLDPDHPRDRLAMVIEDAAPPVLLTQEHLLDVIPPQSAPVFCLDRDWHTLASEPTSNPKCITGGKDQAYAIFTSGSTGKPKGVPNVHEGIVNRLLWMQHAYTLNSTDRVLQKTPYSFDVSVWEFFWPLMTGACLVVAKPEGHKDPNYLIDLIIRQHITTMHFVPSMLRIFLETDQVERCTSLKRVICSGEALPADLETRFFERLKCELHNLYGPTEASVDVTYWPCAPGSSRSSVPIGRPVWNTQIYILDEKLRPVPIGVPGELHIGGVQLARGYLNRPQLTAEKFIRDPFSAEPGARLYKTGDLSRFLPDGTVEYLGRLDHQVKIRGFRIELGEIEATLNEQTGVRQSVVLAREDEPGDKRLVAYIVVDPNYRGPQASASQEDLGAEQVSQWAMTFDEAYSRGGSVEDATFNIVGWNSSYTLQPIPAEEMRVWVETTVERILSLPSERVWEIGCGTGLLLFRVAPKTSHFHGTDVSQKALDFLQQQMKRPELRLPQVTLQRAGAHEFAEDAKNFDSIVINSVIQYFPNIEYLVSVIEGAMKALRPGGAMFIGDVRNFPLLECFHASVQLFQAQDSAIGAEIWDRAQKSLKQEGELVVDPDFFLTLPQRIPQIRQVEIHLKRGRALNELTRFRYDVVLHADDQPAPEAECQWLDWSKERLSMASLRAKLTHSGSDLLGLTGVPNPRLVREVAATETLASNKGIIAEELRKELDQQQLPGFELEELWEIERNLPYAVEIRWSHKALSACDVLFRRKSAAGQVINTARVRFPGEPAVAQPLETYATNPLRQRYAGALIADVRRGLAARLPEYMVPANFVLLDAMPLSPNGKVDRKALPAPDQSRRDVEQSYIAPRTPAEEIVAALWADVLRLERVGVRDDFFQLGGHSLNATQVVSRVREAFRVELPLRALFESPTIEGLAKTIEGLQRTEQDSEASEMVRVSRDREIPLSFAQQRLWFLDQMDPGNHLYNVPRAIRLKGKLNVEAMERAINDLIARHEILRTSYATVNDHPVQEIATELTISLPLFDFSSLPESQREAQASRLVQSESEKGFDLSSLGILRGFVIRLAEEDHVLFLNSHHIATDGWSTGVMINDLSAFYAAALENRQAELPPLEIQYADYAVWQRNWLQGEVLAKQLAYWKKELDGSPPVLSLPTDRPRPAIQTFRGEVYESTLPKNLVASLRILGRQQGSTLFMTMLAGFEGLLYHYTGQPDLVLGTDLANRPTVQTEAMIGFFVNLLVIRTDVSGNPTFEELIKRVREVSLRAYAHQDLPFDKLVEELRPERNLTHSPLVQVLFVQQNTPRSSGNFPGLQMDRFRVDVPSKFDMAVFMGETDGQVIGRWVYNPDLFDASTVVQMANLYETLLSTVATEPNVPLSRIYEALGEAEQRLREAGQKSFHETSLRKLKGARRKAAMAPTNGEGQGE